jgi:hypothetical protein
MQSISHRGSTGYRNQLRTRGADENVIFIDHGGFAEEDRTTRFPFLGQFAPIAGDKL